MQDSRILKIPEIDYDYSLKTYMLGPSNDDQRLATHEACEKILSALKDAYPDGLTTKELVEKTGERDSTVYSYRRDLEKSNFIKEIKGKRNAPGRPSLKDDNPRSSRYILENANYLNYSKDRYQLAPGNVEYTTEFLGICNRLLDEASLDELNDTLLSLVTRIHRQIKESSDEAAKKCAPISGRKTCCPNCNINHEARDFVRALLLRMVDKFETCEGYLRFLSKNEYTSTDFIQPPRPKEMKSTSQSRQQHADAVVPQVIKQQATGSTVLRILSIKKHTFENYLFLAINQDKRFLHGTIESALVTHDMCSNSMIECLTNEIRDTGDSIQIGLSKKTNDFVRVISDNPRFPKVADVVSSIQSIFQTEKENQDDKIVEGVVIQAPEHEKFSDGTVLSNVLLRDITGMIPLLLGEIQSRKYVVGDKILVLGAEVRVHGITGLALGTYGSIVKTGSIDLTDPKTAFPKEVHFKQLYVNKSVSQEGVTVTLRIVHVGPDYTYAALAIDNSTNQEITFIPSDSIAIQNKWQYIGQHSRKFKKINMTIPPGIEENGCILFTGLEPDKPMASFRFRLKAEGNNDFTFTVKLPY